MRNICAVFLKQINETFKNKTILIQFVLFPAFALIMENAIKLQDMPEHFFVKLFAVMFVGMAPLTCMSSILSEEKEKNTLRALLMSNVKTVQYLLGVGSYLWLMCMAGSVVFALCGQYRGKELVAFLLIMAAGILLSILVGAAIGVFSRNQMTATSITIPVMMVFSFFPMIATFNEKIAKFAKITYSQQISMLINNINDVTIEMENVVILLANMLVAIVLFLLAFYRKGLE